MVEGDSHPATPGLRRFLRGESNPRENREIVEHLLKACRRCQEVVASLWQSSPEGACEDTWEPQGVNDWACFDSVFDNVRQREAEFAREREEAPSLVAELEQHFLEHRFLLVANSHRFSTWGVCERLLDLSWNSRYDDTAATFERAQLGVVVSEGLDHEYYGLELVQDLKARAWAHLANAHRLLAELRDAEDAFKQAELFLKQGTGDPVEKAIVLRNKASLRLTQGGFEEALKLYDRTINIYRRLGDDHMVGALLADKAEVPAQTGDIEAAIPLLRESLELLDKDRDPHYLLAARHNLIICLYEHGELEEALFLLQETYPLYIELGDRLNLLRLRRLEGGIAMVLGQLTLAQKAFEEAQRGFVHEGAGFDAAGTCLDLAMLYAQQNRPQEIRELATSMFPVFQALDLHHGAIAALVLFQKAAQAEKVTLDLIVEIQVYLEQAQDNPELQFDPSS